MTPDEFHKMLWRLGFDPNLRIGIIQAAAALHVNETTIRRWLRGDREIPGPVIAALNCFWKYSRRQVKRGRTPYEPRRR